MKRAVLAVVFWLVASAALAAPCSNNVAELRGPWGQARFAVEIADTPKERSRGLMFRESLPASAGMLFVYESPRAAQFWMKNTLIPLDMLFFDRTGTLTRVHHDAIPGDLTGIDGGEGVLAVLEINGGLARQYGIGPGTQIRHPAFSDSDPAWSC